MSRLSADDLNPAIRNVQYAVRGELAIKAEQHRVKLQQGSTHGLPFNQIISSNIGNPQQKGLDQPPLSFVRQVCLLLPPVIAVARHTGIAHAPSQVAALMEYRDLKYLAPNVFPKYVLTRADELLEEIDSIGAYSHSQGVPLIRKHVAEFIHFAPVRRIVFTS